MVISPAAINEPFLLSSHSLTQRTTKSGSNAKSQKGLTGVYASYQKPSSSSDGFVSVAAQSDGIHILDVATLHPTISHTLGPSTTFACAPLTQYQSSGNIHITYAVISGSPDVDASNRCKTIWKWTENPSSPLADRTNQHETVVVPHHVLGLYDCDELPGRIFAISPSGDASILTADLELKTTIPAPDAEDIELLQASVFPRSSCSFLGSQSMGSEGAVMVLIVGQGGSTQIKIFFVGTEDSVNSLYVLDIPFPPREIAAASCSPSGILNFISYTGFWRTFSLSPASVGPSISSMSSPLWLTGLSFLMPPRSGEAQSQRKSDKTSSSPSPTPALLALTSSHILLASLTAQNEIALLLWDTQYSVLLASYMFTLPSPFNSRSSSLVLSLLSTSSSAIKAGSQQAILVITEPASNADGKSPAKSSIYMVPYSVPTRSTLANAMGYGKAAVRWLRDCPSGDKALNEMPEDAAKSKLIASMRTAVEQNRTQTANTLFTEWERMEQQRVMENSQKPTELGYTFVKDVLEVIIQPQKPPNPLYSSTIVQHLLEKGVVCSAMLEGGLLAALRIRNDWQSVDLTLRHVPDLSEGDLVETLSVVAVHHLSKSSSPNTADDSVPQTDPEASTLSLPPPLPDFLISLLKHRNFTTTQLILAFRQHLRGAEVVTSITQILDQWIKKIQSQEVKLMPSKKDVTKNEHGVIILKPEVTKPKFAYDLPPMDKVLAFLQSLLDASFLTLLQHPPAYNVLKSLKSHIEPEIAAVSQTEQLRGLIEGFAKAQAKAIKDGETNKTQSGGGSGKEDKRDWRQRKKEMHEQVGMAVGVYRLEKLVL